MTGKREISKEGRRKRIIDSARRHFLERGYEAATIEAIAETSEVSAVTVYNHYKTKGGVLLALVSASDELLIKKIKRLMKTDYPDTLSAVSAFSETINSHAFSYLNRELWRHILAASIIEGDSDFGQAYKALDDRLVRMLAGFLEKLREDGIYLNREDISTAAEVIYNLHNARFQEYIIDSSRTETERDRLTRRDLAYTVNQCTVNPDA